MSPPRSDPLPLPLEPLASRSGRGLGALGALPPQLQALRAALRLGEGRGAAEGRRAKVARGDLLWRVLGSVGSRAG